MMLSGVFADCASHNETWCEKGVFTKGQSVMHVPRGPLTWPHICAAADVTACGMRLAPSLREPVSAWLASV